MPQRILIIGAGLSGLVTAKNLLSLEVEVIVLEARDRCGGRCLSENEVDLGPAWTWPGHDKQLGETIVKILIYSRKDCPAIHHGAITSFYFSYRSLIA